MEKNIIVCDNVSYKYKNNDNENVKLAVDHVNFQVKKGEFLVVLGRNGSGKSTMAKHINALLTPTDGKVYVEDIDTSDEKNTWKVRNKVGMVFQNPDNQIVATIVEEDVAFGF